MRVPKLAAVLLSALLLTGCTSEHSLFDSTIGQEYQDSEILDDQFIEAIKSSGKTNRILTDEEYIRYGKAMCTLLDTTDSPTEIILEYRGEDQVVSDAAIQVYCPQYSRYI